MRSFSAAATPALELANPISERDASMRPSLLPGLIAAARQNGNRGFDDLAMFEVGQIYRGDRPEDQLTAVSGIRTGTAKLAGGGRRWDGAAKPVDVFDAKADALAVLAMLGSTRRRYRSRAGRPAGSIPGGRARSGSARRLCSACSANCIPTC